MMAGSVLAMTIANLLARVLQFGSGVLVARLLGADGRGNIALAQNWLQAAVWFWSMGCQDGIQRSVARDRKQAGPLLGTGLAFVVGLGLIGAVIGSRVIPLAIEKQSIEARQALGWLIWTLPIGLAVQNVTGVLLGLRSYRALVWRTLLAPFLYVSALAFLVMTRTLTVQGALIAFAISELISGLPILMAVFRERTGIRMQWRGFPTVAGFGLKAHLGGMAALANASLDRLLLGAWLPASQLGLYTVAVTLATLPTALVSGVTQLALAESASRPGAIEPLIELSRLVFGTMIAVSLLLAPVALFGVPLIYGAGFRGAVPSALVLLAGLPPYATLGMLRQTATGQDRPWAGSQSEGIALVCTIVGLASLVPTLGILGAAITSTVTYYVVYLLLAWMVTRDMERSISAAIRPRFPDGRFLSSLGRQVVNLLLRRRVAGVLSG